MATPDPRVIEALGKLLQSGANVRFTIDPTKQTAAAAADDDWPALVALVRALVRERHGREARALVIETTDGETIRLPLPPAR